MRRWDLTGGEQTHGPTRYRVSQTEQFEGSNILYKEVPKAEPDVLCFGVFAYACSVHLAPDTFCRRR
jgi:hypothetical protein